MWTKNKGVAYVGLEYYFLGHSYCWWEPQFFTCWLKKWNSATDFSRRGVCFALPISKFGQKKDIKPFEKCDTSAEQNRLQRVAEL